MEFHVDPLGGWSGDMFVAAMLDAMPAHWPAVEAAVAALDLGPAAACHLIDHRDHALTGRRFAVAAEARAAERHDHRHDAFPDSLRHAHEHSGAHGHDEHAHRAWADIRGLIDGSRLAPEVRSHATAIFALLAGAEARVHGLPEADVTFHEVGAIDSIVDIVAAAVLIARAAATRWTSSPLPLGSGRVRTAHGVLPVPAPATALLLQGLPTVDDGIPGERVTPTGAAIARHLLADAAPASGQPRRLMTTGTGFGSRTLRGVSNCLRVLAFDAAEGAPWRDASLLHRTLAVVTFEVDDQSPEDLAHGLDHLRGLAGVHDVVHTLAYGKKGRMAMQVQVLAAPAALDTVVRACFAETTTIGLRHHIVEGAALTRAVEAVEIDGQALRVKSVRRPDGTYTAKTEAGDVAAHAGHSARVALRRAGEALALARRDDEREDGPDAG